MWRKTSVTELFWKKLPQIRVARFFLVQHTKREKVHQIAIKYTKRA
jgi:hypothetical protein